MFQSMQPCRADVFLFACKRLLLQFCNPVCRVFQIDLFKSLDWNLLICQDKYLFSNAKSLSLSVTDSCCHSYSVRTNVKAPTVYNAALFFFKYFKVKCDHFHHFSIAQWDYYSFTKCLLVKTLGIQNNFYFLLIFQGPWDQNPDALTQSCAESW